MSIAAWTKDREALREASSGGIFYELAKYFISKGGLVCGVVMVGTKAVFHATGSIEEVKRMRGSKYLWANPRPIYKTIIQAIRTKRLVLFVGLPCQVIELKKWLRTHGFDNHTNTYVSLRCHGVIKQKIYNNYIQHLKSIFKKPIENIIFRSKIDGWTGAGFGFNSRFFKPKLIKDYLRYKNIHPMCKNCTKDRYDCDITLGDYWGCHPAYRNNYGTSRVDINTSKGYDIFRKIEKNITWQFVEKLAKVNSNKIGLLKVADIKNFGNLMLSSNFITYMKRLNENAQFVFIEEQSAQDTIEVSTGVKGIEYRKLKSSPMEFFKRLVNPAESNLVQTFADCKHVVILGGDYLTGKWNYKSWVSNLVMINALNKCGKHVRIVSNTVGEFPWLLRPFIRAIFNDMKTIWCRGRDSLSRCLNLGVYKNVNLADDLAFLPLYNELSYNMEKRYKQTYCVIIISTLWKRYASTYENYIKEIKIIANNLHALTQKQIFVISHSLYDVDIKIACDVAEGEKNINTVEDPENATPSAIRNLLAHSYLNVSFRMHGAISSLTKGVPVVAIAYSHKYKGVIADGYELPELVVDKIGAATHAIIMALEHYDSIKGKIAKVNLRKQLKPLYPLLEILEDSI